MVDGDSTTYYKNDEGKVNVETTGYNAKYEPGAGGQAGTLTLKGLDLTVNGNTDGIFANGDLVINLEESSKIKTEKLAIYAWFGNLTISGTGSLEAKNEIIGSENSLIYAQGNIVINDGAQVIATTKSHAQAINANAGNIEISGEGTSVKAISYGSTTNSDAIRVNSGKGTGNGTVTIKGSAVLEAETKSSSAKAINGNVVATDYAGKIIAGESKEKATSLTGTTISADNNTYKYIRIGEAEPNYLTFTAEKDSSSVTLNYESGADVQYKQYTKTSNTWGEWTTYTAGTAIPLAKGDQVSFKGKNIKTNLQKHFSMTGKIAASGSVTSLTDENGNNPNLQLQNECYKYMFYNCKNLTTAPTLPATSLANDCYDSMFYECENLTTAPILPAVNIPSGAYASMFFGCTSLSAAPELSATSIDNGSYYHMFYGCTNLTTPPSNLPATILKENCYFGMFSGCKKLKSVPQIKATQLPKYCFNYMFNGCSNLSIRKTQDDKHTIAWSINATTSEDESFWNDKMFDNLSTLDFPVKTNQYDNKQHKAPELNTIYYVNPNGANSGGTTHTHQWSTAWESDGTHHWHECTTTGCDVTVNASKNGYAEHIADTAAWKHDETNHWRVCKDCGAEITSTKEAHSSTGNNTATCKKKATCDVCKTEYGGTTNHTENTSKWVYDAEQHWRTCIYGCNTIVGGKVNHTFSSDGKCSVCKYTKGSTVNPTPNPTPSGSSGGGYIAPSTDVKTSGSADSKVTSSPSTVQNETRTDASGKQETVAKVTVSAANQREILSQAKANKSKRIIIQIAKTAVQGDAKLELNLDKTFVQSILHDTEASLTIRTADGDRVIAREALETLVAQTEGNTVVIDPAAQENPTDPAEPSKAETLAALDSSRLVARSKLVTLKNGRKGIRITWSDKNGAEMNFDGVEIYRSTKKNRFGKKPFYATKGSKSAGYYINSKGIRSGVTYYYKVRGYVLIDGQKHYTDLSLKAIRTVK